MSSHKDEYKRSVSVSNVCHRRGSDVSCGQDEKRVCIVFLGAGQTGKTSIIKQFLNGEFSDKYRATVEDIYSRNFEINNCFLLNADFLDTSGSFHFTAMRRICISKAAAFVLVFAFDNQFSLNAVRELWQEIREQREDHDNTPLVVAGHKCDLIDTDEITVLPNVVDEFLDAENLRSKYVPCSAKLNSGIFELFQRLWQMNEECNKITIDMMPMSNKRRFSAFAALTQSPLTLPFEISRHLSKIQSPHQQKCSEKAATASSSNAVVSCSNRGHRGSISAANLLERFRGNSTSSAASVECHFSQLDRVGAGRRTSRGSLTTSINKSSSSNRCESAGLTKLDCLVS